MFTRRDLLKFGVSAGIAAALPGAVGNAQRMGGGGGGGGCMCGGGGGTSSPPTPLFGVPLPSPPVLTPMTMSHMGEDYDYYEITQKIGYKQIIPGLWTTVWGYDGLYPGPTIMAKQGKPVWLRVNNALPENTVVHLHGGHVPVEMDGHAMDYILPGSFHDYFYPNNQIASTIWYHDHTMDRTGAHVIKGLAGFYIIQDDFENSLPLPKGTQDVAFVIQDRLFNADGSFNYTLNNMSVMHGFQGDVVLVNGAPQPYFKVATRKYRFRILNGSNARQYELALSTGDPFVQIGSDGGLLQAPVTRSSLFICPGERVEVIVDFSKHRVGRQIVLKNLLGSGRTADVMRFDVSRKESDDAIIPRTLRTIERIPESMAMRTRQFVLGMSMNNMQPMLTINGLAYDHMRVDADPMLDCTEIWEFVNPMNMYHPMHAHDIMWQILDRNGTPPPAYEMGWKDTWFVPPGGRVRVIGKFTDYTCDGGMTGMSMDMEDHLKNYMVHCHILEHEDHGMMAQFKVMTPNTPM
jgi:spore coat protein A